jgi:hypothetical protein
MEPTDKTILGIRTLIERNILVTERFIQSLVGEFGKTAYSQQVEGHGVLKHAYS